MSHIPVHSAHLRGTALGSLRIWATAAGVRRLDFEPGPDLAAAGEALATGDAPPHLSEALRQLRAYLDGERRSFDLPLDLEAGLTPFRRSVYDYLLAIPYGQVVTYGQVAEGVGLEPGAASRAVGQAVGANPVPIIIPCHRVVGATGRLTGFGGGTARKAWLLAIEGIDVDGPSASSRVHPEVLRLPL